MRAARCLLVTAIILACVGRSAAAEQPAVWWKFDAGVAKEGPSLWTSDGKFGGALALSGGAYVRVGEIGTFDALTIALWVRPDALGDAFNVLAACEGWGRSMVHFQFTQDGRVEFSVNGNNPVDAFSAAAPGKNLATWHHIAVAYDSKAKKVRFFINGKLDKELAYQSAGPVHLGPLRLGAWDKEPRLLAGRLDDVRFYSKALDDAAIAKVAAGEEVKDGLEAWWRMDEKQGAKVADASGKGRDGTLVGGGGAGSTQESISGVADEIRGKFKFVAGVAASAMRFDGGTAVIRKAAKAPRMNPDGFSIEAWVALASYPRGRCTIAEQQSRPRGYCLAIDPQGHFSLQFALGYEWKDTVSIGRIPLRKWVHLAATYSPDSGVNLYINGKPEGNLVLLGPLWFAESADLSIGRGLDGLLDDLAIHRAELSPKEVLTHYEAGKAAPEPALGE
jgi:hypothetical protein